MTFGGEGEMVHADTVVSEADKAQVQFELTGVVADATGERALLVSEMGILGAYLRVCI